MIVDNINDFVKFLPNEVRFLDEKKISDFYYFKTFIEEAQDYVIDYVIGDELFFFIKEKENERVKNELQRFVSLKAYQNYIPLFDVETTENGYSVVSSAGNFVPASKERMQKFKQSINDRLNNSFDCLISIFLKGETNEYRNIWKENINYDRYTNCLFITSYEFSMFAKKEANRKDLDEAYSILMSYQNILSENVSYEYFDEIIEKKREDKLTFFDKKIKNNLQIALGLFFNKNEKEAHKILEKSINFMIENKDEFITYINSNAFKMRGKNNYRNKKNDGSFMFGM